MRIRLISVALFIAASLGPITLAQAPEAVPVTVSEQKASAILKQNAIDITLPLTVPAVVDERVTAWLLSPVDTPSGETRVVVRAGGRAANVLLPWPNDATGKPVEEIGWYRIGYRVEAEGAPQRSGVLAIGAIAHNLMALRMVSPATLLTGKPLSVRVFAGNPITREPFRGVYLEAGLVIDLDTTSKEKSPKRTILRNAITDRSGEAIFTFPFPTSPAQSATLTVKGKLTDSAGQALHQATISKDFESDDKTVIRVDTDKPLHKPGEVVHMRALVFNDSGHAAANTPLTLTIKDPEYKTLLEAPLTTNKFGIAFYDWKTASQIAPGDYDVSFDIDATSDYAGEGSTTIRIQHYELPEFSVSATADHGYYLAGQSPVVHIHAGYLFGKPVADGSVKIVRVAENQWNRRTGKSEEPAAVEKAAALDAKGDAEVHLDVKSEFDDLKSRDYERFVDLHYRAIVTDATTGRSEPRTFAVRLTKEPVHIYLGRAGGNEHEGDYILRTNYADGTPVSAKVNLYWMDSNTNATRAASVKTSQYGLAKVHLRYPAVEKIGEGLSLRMIARDPVGRESKLDDTITHNQSKIIWISVDHTVLKPKQPIETTLHGAVGSIIDVDVLTETGIASHQQIRMAHSAEPLTVPAGDDFHGLVTLRAYELNSVLPEYRYEWPGRAGYKTVLYPEDRELKLKIAELKTSYVPGGAVTTTLSVRNADGTPVLSALGISVIDTAVEERAATEAEANDRWYGWSWWQDNESVSGVTLANLNRIDTSLPIADDLDLAAEALLLQSRAATIEIDAEDDSAVRYQYENEMKRDLKPIGEAVMAARPERLPNSIDALRGVTHTAKLDDALMLDPWNTQYKVERSIEYNNEVLTLVSAGPDKRFSTDDDFRIEIARRNVFALPGEQMTKLLSDAVASGHNLPGTVVALKQFTREHGMNLDSIFDPEGKPITYTIEVHGASYSIHVSNHSESTIWTSPSIAYFSVTEMRLENAIREWTNANKPFPDTEAEARQAFTASGIDFDSLRDPLGAPFQLRSTQVMAYTRVEKVKAGNTLDVKSKPVTHLLRAIQVLRTPSQADSENATEIIAQFLHPITEQSGGDSSPQSVDEGTFKANTGAIGGTVSDRTGAVISDAVVEVETTSGTPVATATTLANGSYLISDLAPGLYKIRVSAKGFQSYGLTDVHVSAVALTTIDVELNVGTTAETVEVTAESSELMTTQSESSLATVRPGIVGPDGKSIIVGSNGKAIISEPTFTPRLRHVFEETAYWAPSLETSASGQTILHFTLPDSLTTWKLHALASTIDGRVGTIDQSFKTFQPFFVDLDAPQVLTVGDEITLPVNLRNYTSHALSLPVTAKAADWFSLFTPAKVDATVSASGTTAVRFGFRATKPIEAGPLNITAANAHEGDAVEKTVRVHPDGEPRSVTASGLLRSGSTTLTLDLPAEAIPGSMHAELRLYPNLGAHILHSMKAVLERPYGCGEQTISSTYPSLLFLKLLKFAKTTSPIENDAQTYLQLGYDRLLGYFEPSGGLTYWGGNDHAPDAALTAYGIEFLTDAEPYISIDQNHILSAVRWLIANQQADGSWKPHYGDTNANLNLYIASVLAQALSNDAFIKSAPKDLREQMSKAVARATDYAATSVAAAHDPYANALRLRLTTNAATAAILRTELANEAQHDQNGAHWVSQNYSPFYGWGHAGEVEITAQVLNALTHDATAPHDQALQDESLFYLLRSQDRYGIWYSGQATVRVLQAMLPLAAAQLTASSGSNEFHLTINGHPLSEKDAQALQSDPKLLSAPRSLDLTALLNPGNNQLIFTNENQSALASVDASESFYVPWPEVATPVETKTKTGKEFGLDFGYKCDASKAEVGNPINCKVDLRRFGSNNYGMLLAEVGLPPGANVDRASLGKLLDSGSISRYELQPDRIIFYVWSWRAEATHFDFRFTPRYAIHAKAAPATLSDYYNPDFKTVLLPQTFDVSEHSQKTTLNDANH